MTPLRHLHNRSILLSSHHLQTDALAALLRHCNSKVVIILYIGICRLIQSQLRQDAQRHGSNGYMKLAVCQPLVGQLKAHEL